MMKHYKKMSVMKYFLRKVVALKNLPISDQYLVFVKEKLGKTIKIQIRSSFQNKL